MPVTASQTWLLDSSTEYSAWTHVTGTNVTAAFDGTTTDADATGTTGSIKYTLATSSSGGAGYAEISNTWEGWGVPAGTTVKKVSVTAAWQVTANTRISGSSIGPFTLRDSSGNLTETVSAATGISAITTWADKASGVYTLTTPQASSSTVRLRIGHTVATGGGTGPNVALAVDWIRLVIYFEPAAWNFSTLAEYNTWTHSTGTNVTASHDTVAATDAAGGAGFIRYALATISSGGAGYSEFSDTWEGLGVAAGKMISQVRVTAYWKVISATRLSTSSLIGPFTLRDSAGNLLDTLASADALSTTTSWASKTSGWVSLATPQASSATFRIRLGHTLLSTGSGGTNIALGLDSVVFEMVAANNSSVTAAATTTLSPAFSLNRIKVLAINAASTLTAAFRTSWGKTLNAAVTMVGAVRRSITETLAYASDWVEDATLALVRGRIIPGNIRLRLKRDDGQRALRYSTLLKLTSLVNNFAQAIAATGTFTASATKQVSKTVAAALTATAAQLKSVNKSIAGAATLTAEFVKSVAKKVAAGSTLSVAYIRSTTKTVAALLSGAAAYIKGVSKNLSITSTLTSAVRKAVSKTVALAASLPAAIGRGFSRALDVVSLSLDAVLTAIESAVRSYEKVLEIASAFSVALSKIPQKLLAVGESLSLSIEKTTIKFVAVGTLFTISILKQMEKRLPGSASLALAFGKTAGKFFQLSLSAGMSLSRRLNKVFAVAAALTTRLDKTVRKTLALAVSLPATLARLLAKRLAAAMTATAAFTRRRGKALAVSASLVAVMTRNLLVLIYGLARGAVTRITNIVSRIDFTAIARGRADKE